MFFPMVRTFVALTALVAVLAGRDIVDVIDMWLANGVVLVCCIRAWTVE